MIIEIGLVDPHVRVDVSNEVILPSQVDPAHLPLEIPVVLRCEYALQIFGLGGP